MVDGVVAERGGGGATPVASPCPPLDVLVVSIGLPHDSATVREQSLGGSETAAIYVAEALARHGHRVTVYSPLPPRQQNGQPVGDHVMHGVTWRDLNRFPGECLALPYDVAVVSRDLNLLRQPINAKLKYLWCHDLAIKRVRQHYGPTLWNTTGYYVLSGFQRQQYMDVVGLPLEQFVVTRNGIDPSSFPQGLKRDPLKLVYGSRPERGLEAALLVMDVLRKRGSQVRLEVSGYDAPGLAPQMQGYYQQLFQAAAARPNVVVRGSLTQAQWHDQLATARALLYPSCPGDFREISCVVAMEAQACGTPVVAAAKGALPETLNGGSLFGEPSLAALLVGDETSDPHAPAYVEAFADAVERITSDDLLWARLSQQGRTNADGLTWDGVAEQWAADWAARFDAMTGDLWRMERHAVRIGDREVAA
jgi:glycosyltransferase involved in cell wall biosynthesis